MFTRILFHGHLNILHIYNDQVTKEFKFWNIKVNVLFYVFHRNAVHTVLHCMCKVLFIYRFDKFL